MTPFEKWVITNPAKEDHMAELQHNPLPVSGYKAQSESSVALVNGFKRTEESILRSLDALKSDAAIDQRWLAIGRTHLEQAFMAINRSVFRPDRVKLPGDEADRG